MSDTTGSLSGRYFCDTNDNDVEDSVDPGITGVWVTLINGGVEIASTTTDANGAYAFSGLHPGLYDVRFTDRNGVLAGKSLVAANVGSDDAIDSDAIGDATRSSISSIEVIAGQETPDNDAGAEYATGALSGRYFCDDNGDGVDNGEPGVAGKLVSLLTADGGTVLATTTTGSDGGYAFTNLTPGAYVVAFEGSLAEGKRFVRPDVGGDDSIDSDVIDPATGRTAPVTVVAGATTADVDAGVADDTGALSGRYFCDDNGDGVDNGEPGVAGKLVSLLTADGGTVLATTTTGSDGGYAFTNLTPGAYVVAFEDSLTEGKRFVRPDVGGDDSIDSDVIDPATGRTAPVTVVAGATTADVDAGVADDTGALSGRYFCDDNGDGVDNGEPGVAGKLVSLLTADGGTVLATTTTGSDGGYAFTNLTPGAYVVAFEDSLAEGKRFVRPDVGGDDSIDSDVIDPATGRTAPVTVVAGATTADVDAGVFDQAFAVNKAISNIVVYLDCDGPAGDRITKVKFDDFDFKTKELSLSQVEDALGAVGFDDCDVLGLTVKAGNNKGGFGPGEGQYFDVDLTDALVTGTRAKADVAFDADDVFGFV